MDNTFWVIERFEDGQSRGYWFGNSSREFSIDIDSAIQFRRRTDASRILLAWHWKDCEVTEHKYCDLPISGLSKSVVFQNPAPHSDTKVE